MYLEIILVILIIVMFYILIMIVINIVIISTNEEYYTNGVDTYVIVDIGLELSDNYKYVNLVLELKLLKDDKRVFDYLFK